MFPSRLAGVQYHLSTHIVYTCFVKYIDAHHNPELGMKPDALLPLKPDVFQILLTLLEGESHGYVIMQEIAERTGGEVRMLPGALYRHLQRMLEDGVIHELDRRRVDPSSDERRRYYAITRFGRRVAEAEATRLAQLVNYARSKDLVNDAKLS